MSVVDLIMPKLGESIMEATILKWHKKPGDAVKQDETVLDIATDKVDSEVPSTSEGIIEEILFKENDVVPIGTVIAKIRVGSGQAAASQPAAPVQPVYEEAKLVEDIPYQPTDNRPQTADSQSSHNKIRFYSPLVLNIAQQEGISMAELENIPGTGQDGRVSKKDILAYVGRKESGGRSSESGGRSSESGVRSSEFGAGSSEFGAGSSESGIGHQQQVTVLPSTSNQQQTSNIQPPTSNSETTYQPPTVFTGNVEIIEMDRMRKLISKHMTDSKRISAHVTSFAECDVTNLVLWRNKVKKEFESRENEKITFTPLFIEAIVKCIKKYPLLSSSVEGDKIIVKKDINIGMATALPSGNLIVPVIKNADQLNLTGLTKQVNNLANNARTGKLKPDDTNGGTFTLTNVGTFGSIMGTPIINQPQVAIMAVGAIKKRPMVIETPQGDSIAIRHMMYISLSYDHRIIDGALGSTFLNAVSKELENFDVNRAI